MPPHIRRTSPSDKSSSKLNESVYESSMPIRISSRSSILYHKTSLTAESRSFIMPAGV